MKKSNSQGKIFSKSFSGATTKCMIDYSKPSLAYNPDTILLHCGSNDLKSEKNADVISNEIIDLAMKIKSGENDVIISGIITRNDASNEKRLTINELLETKCVNNNLKFCDNSNIKSHHLNGSGVHLKPQGTYILANNFLNILGI